MKPIRLIRSVVTVGGWTLLSRGAGFVRDVMMAAYLGSGPVAEAFFVAFSLPNMFRRFFAEGAFNMAFVPMFAKKLETGDDAQGFARDAFSGLAGVLLIFSLIGTLLMPWLVMAMAWGWIGDERFALTVMFGRITFVYILFISLVALLSGVLNTFGRFTEASFVPVLMNLMFIAAMLLADRANWDMGLTLAWTVPLTGVAQFLFTWFSARRQGFTLLPHWPRLTPDLKRLLIIAGPAVLSGGVVQVNLLVGRGVASWTDGAVAWLNYADRLYQLPLGVVGIAIGTVLLPDLSRRLRAGDAEGGRASFNRGTEFALALTLPAAVALVVIAGPLVGVLYGRGSWTAEDTWATALALAIYGAGLPAFVMHKVLQPLYYAREDTRRPFRYALWSMGVNAALAVGLSPLIGFAAAALATTLSAWTMVWQLWSGSRGMGAEAQWDDRLKSRLPRIIAAAALMGAVLWVAAGSLAPLLAAPGWRYLALAGLVAIGVVSYFGGGAALGAFRLSDFKGLRRRR
ncbi:murein biosynthesis integral membrane protein MurJ [Pararhodobacter aggregans]|uniref:Probable lipid II flippase MurJ n=1 Tax=Pararhodobacter aggregans TaxID=404875 RepID=A0A2T7USZ8_9RHOB|nr:murein biosynthesis integral membrane protein MurJ [Pararhodobacter aggregans]PTX02652.1 putative peptidoglycan lipid II flippase [Pararhodobacter aggregans]PVE47885.1 murein biosynthesis integral membrane protein MurJ [Pararhodobacter aggregans]